MNICILSQEFPPYTNWGGIATYNSEFANAFCRKGQKVTVISRMTDKSPPRETLSNGIEVWRIGHTTATKVLTGRTVDKLLYSRAVYRKVKELNRVNKFDILETTEAGLEGEWLLRDPVYAPRTVIQCNGSNYQCVIPEGFFSHIHRADRWCSYWLEQKSLQRAQNILVTSEATKKFLTDRQIPSDKIQLIYQGIDTTRFHPNARPEPPKSIRVGFVGRLERIKGIDFIWRLMETIGPKAGISFHFKGAIHWTARREVEENLGKFSDFAFYYPPGSHEEMPNFYRSLHVLLQPSRFENFGLAYVEGMASGLIVFAGKNGGGPEIIQDKVNGFIIDPDGDATPIANKIREISSNLLNFSGLARRARETVVKRFSIDACAQEKIAYYTNLNVSGNI